MSALWLLATRQQSRRDEQCDSNPCQNARWLVTQVRLAPRDAKFLPDVRISNLPVGTKYRTPIDNTLGPEATILRHERRPAYRVST